MAKNHFSRADVGSWGVSPGVRGLVCIEKWSHNFDSGTQNAISGTPKLAKLGSS